MWTTASPSDPRRPSAHIPLALLGLLALAPRAAAQDSHYWSIQYGPVGQLVGGLVIGGVPDLSATFYNPGALALRTESSYLLSTESFQWEVVSTEPTPGPRIFDASSSTVGAAPSLIAGVLPRWLGEDTGLAWSYLTRQKLDLRLGRRLTDPLPSPWETSAAESYVDQDIEESWGGLTVSRRLSESVGLGLSLYGVYRGQRTRNEVSTQAVAGDGRSLAVSGVTDFDYWHARTLAKLGLAWNTVGWSMGLSVTTPSLSLFGSGKVGYTRSLSGIDADGDGIPDPPSLATETAEGLDTRYRSSWALGAGASRRLGRTRFYTSVEWFAPVDRFTVVALPGVPGEEARLTQELGHVLNAGLGFEHVLSEDVSAYGAFHTDFSASVGGSEANVAVSDLDLYHFSGGASFRIRDNRFTLGALWASGRKTRALRSPLLPEAGAGLESALDVRYSRITFLLGFEFGR